MGVCARMHVSREGGVWGVGVAVGVSEMEKLKRQKGVCRARAATTHLLLDGREETAETETDKLTERERERGMIKRIAAIMMRPLTGWTLSPSSLLSSMSILL